MAKAKRKRHPGHITQRGSSFFVRLRVGGMVYRKSLKVSDRRAAEVFAVEKYQELVKANERRAEGLPEVVRFSALLAEFDKLLLEKCAGTQRSYNDSLKPIREFFVERGSTMNDPRVDKIRPGHIEDYLSWRRTNRMQGLRKTDGGALSASTLNKDRTILHRLFTIAEKREYVQGNPVRHVERRKADKHEPVILTPEQYEALLSAAASARANEHLEAAGNPMLALYVLLLGETGVRCESEALHLRWEDVSLESGFITVVSGRDGHRTKSGKSRQVPMTKRLAEAMRAHFAAHRFVSQSPYVFTHSATLRNHAQGQRIRSLRSAFKSAAKAAGLPAKFRQHDLRYRRVTSWLAAGKSPVQVQHAMGHSKLEMTMAYYRFLPEHLSDLVAETPARAAM